MTTKELNQLNELLTKLMGERLKELDEEYPDNDIYNMDCEELYELDDGDNLCQGIDIVQTVISNMRGD